MDALYSPKIQKQSSTLSELAKGVGDIAIINQQEKRLEILLDESVIILLVHIIIPNNLFR